jgi:hypothetical protein
MGRQPARTHRHHQGHAGGAASGLIGCPCCVGWGSINWVQGQEMLLRPLVIISIPQLLHLTRFALR